MRGDNPEVVQPENFSRPNSWTGTKTPVFLIHDGGGTTFAYHCLDPLSRSVYGIRNPHFHSGDVFEGGLLEMARLYSSWIRGAVAGHDFPARRNPDGSTDILLGGWSLGGMLSLEVARELADDPDVRVVGILMIDSIHPRLLDVDTVRTAPPDRSEVGKSKNEILSQRAMAEAGRMIKKWRLPVWDNRSGSKRPRAVLLRATDCVPTDGPDPSVLDLWRNDRTLGWDAYDENLFDAVIDVEGHHFDLFHSGRVHNTTMAVHKGLKKLDEINF